MVSKGSLGTNQTFIKYQRFSNKHQPGPNYPNILNLQKDKTEKAATHQIGEARRKYLAFALEN